MKLTALCCTYLRPELLGNLIESFLRQDYPRELRELLILDDAGQYKHQEGDGWRLISVSSRFNTLGEKRNTCAALATSDVEALVIADDDDIYLPHWFSAHAKCLENCAWSRPSLALFENGDGLVTRATDGLYHASWAYRRDAFYTAGGYRAMNSGEDQDLGRRFLAAGIHSRDTCEASSPYFICGVHTGSYHLSYMAGDGYQQLASEFPAKVDLVQIGWTRDYTTLPVIFHDAEPPNPVAEDGLPVVEMIRKVQGLGTDGPTHGMHALQNLLKKRIDAGIDWLRLVAEPTSPEVIPWFWHWGDRSRARSWNEQGRPFISGPNQLFMNSRMPRCDVDESALLDAAQCRTMFCHSEWYRDLIAQHRGPANVSPMVLWPYPIDFTPGPPLPAEFDLLIYEKNGVPSRLVEFLMEALPRHIHFRYGKYTREELIQAARKSRACAYLADDDHGALALAEILLGGCPAVGVKTGVAFVRDGLNGIVVARLPSEHDSAALSCYLDAIRHCQTLNGQLVHLLACDAFDEKRIVDAILSALQHVRQSVNSERLELNGPAEVQTAHELNGREIPMTVAQPVSRRTWMFPGNRKD